MKTTPVIAAAAANCLPIAWLAVSLAWATPAIALDSARRADSYSIQGWSSEQGLPSSKIRGIAETRDGYLWIATAQGMARFDGMHFTVFTRATNPELGGGGFYSVVEAPDGTLWCGGDNGLFCWRDGHFEHFTTREGLADDYVRMLFLSRNGAVVVCTRNGFSFIRDGHITTPGGVWKQVSSGARSFLERADGSILLGNVEKVWRISGEHIEPYSGIAGLPGDGFSGLAETPDGSVWVGYNGGLRRVYPDGKTEDYGEAQGLMDPQVVALRTDRDGNLWIGTAGGGLYRLAHDRIEAATYTQQFGATPIRQIYEDREGGLWVATATGLFRLKDNISSSIGLAQGLKQTSVSAILETRDGSWWIGLMNSGVYRYDGTRATPLALPAQYRLDEVTSLAEEPAGTLWIGTLSGLYRHAGGVTTNLYQREQEAAWRKQLAARPGALLPGLVHRRVNSIAPDGNGGIWVATDGGLYHGGEGGFRVYTQTNGLPGNTFKSVIRSRHGDIWAVVPPEGVTCFHDGRWTNYLCGKAISGVFPRKVYEDTAGTIWVTTEGGGLNRFKAGRWRTFTAREGLEEDYISGITEDNLGNLWIGCPSGIMRIPLKQFDELDAGRRAVLQPRIVNQSDGLASAEVNIMGSPNESLTRDGRLLFATDRGVAVIQPSDLRISTLLLPMHIERFVVNGADVGLSGPQVIPPGKNDVQIHYTAISLLAAEKVRFRIRLAPLDRDWLDTGDRRDVRYAKLPPGHYTFRVTACNSDGVWNEEGVALAFTVQPFFYQTAWFVGLVVVTTGGAGFGIYRVRARQVRRRTAELERVVKERTRELQTAKEAAEAAVNARNEVIANLQQAEEALRESQALHHSLVENLPAGVFRKNEDGRYVLVNTVFCQLKGLKPADFLGKRPREVVVSNATKHEPEGPATKYAAKGDEIHALIMQTGKSFEEEEEYIGPDGRKQFMHVVRSPVSGADGRIIGTQGILLDITQRKQAERRLARSLSLLNATLESTADGILVVDIQGRVTSFNSKFTEIWHLSPGLLAPGSDEALLQEITRQTLHPESFLAKIRECHSQPAVESFDVIELKDGRTFERFSKPQRLEQECVGRVWSFRDITERKTIERQIAESRNFLDRIINSISDPIFVKDRQHRSVLVNDAFCHFIGHKREELQQPGKSDFDFFPKAEASGFWATDEAVLTTGIENINEETFTDVKGLAHTIITKKNLYTDEKGEVFIVGVIRDITERQQAEEALRESQSLYQSLVDQLPAGVFRKDRDGRYVFVNSWFCRLKGAKPEDYLGKRPQELVAGAVAGPGAKHSEADRMIAAGVRHHESITKTGQPIELEELFSGSDGKIQYFHVVKSPVFGPGGAIVGSQGILLDVTQRKHAEVELEKVHRQLVNASRQAGMAEVATSVLHNVGNVLNSVNVSTILILDTLRKSKLCNLGRLAVMVRDHRDHLAAFITTDPQGRQLPDYLSRLAEHLTGEQAELLKEVELTRNHVEHIKDIVAMQQSYAKVSGVVEKTWVVDLVEDALRLNGGALARHDIQVIRDFPAQAIEINVDRQNVLQVLVNLIRNAKYACDESGRPGKQLTMQVRNGDGRVQIAVMDNGVGIPAENMTRIFNHGFTTRESGHGFGLHSGALTAKELGGTLTAHSDGPGKGAVFVLELPLEPNAPTE